MPNPIPAPEGSFAAALQDARKKRGHTQASLAERCGIGSPYLSKIERGLERPSKELVYQMASALLIDLDEFAILAGHIPDKIMAKMQKHPAKATAMLRHWAKTVR